MTTVLKLKLVVESERAPWDAGVWGPTVAHPAIENDASKINTAVRRLQVER